MKKLSAIITLIFIIMSCNLLRDKSADQTHIFELNPDLVCANSTADEWTRLGLEGETVMSILVHPQNPQVIFAGTGFDFSAQRNGKIFRSTDCGRTWQKIYEGGSFRGLLLHPEDPYTLFAWPQLPTGGLLRTIDGGEHWELYSEEINTDGETTMMSALLINPRDPNIMFAGTSGFWSGSLYKSVDGGQHWENITDKNDTHFSFGAVAMYMHPYDPDLLLHSADGSTMISRSEDSGESWENVYEAVGKLMTYDINPENPDQIAANVSRIGILISEDRGKTWQLKEIPDSLSVNQSYDIKFINNSIYLAASIGVLKIDDFENYEFLGRDIMGPRALALDFHEQNLYMGKWYIPSTENYSGGIYVKKLE